MTTHACFVLFLSRQPPVGQGLLINEVYRSHTHTHTHTHTKTQHSRKDSSGPVISSSQIPLTDITHNTQQQTDILAPGGIRTHNISRRAAADLSPRPRAATGTGINASGDFIYFCFVFHQFFSRIITFYNHTLYCTKRIKFITRYLPGFQP